MGIGLGAVNYRIDDVLHANDSSGGSEELFDEVVVSEGQSLVVFLDVTTLAHQVVHQLLGRVTKGDVVLNQKDSLDVVRARVEEDCVVDLLQTEGVEDLLRLGGDVVGPN